MNPANPGNRDASSQRINITIYYLLLGIQSRLVCLQSADNYDLLITVVTLLTSD